MNDIKTMEDILDHVDIDVNEYRHEASSLIIMLLDDRGL